MFPHIPVEAIQYDLQKTGSVEQTCDNILREGTLPLVRGDHGVTFSNLFFSGAKGMIRVSVDSPLT